MEKLLITKEFIEEWSSRYDKPNIGGDEPEYKQIVNKVHEEISQTGTVSQETFTATINWKSQRAKRKIDIDDFELYQTAITFTFDLPDELKLSLLCGLDGIGLPVGSTILHFMHPDIFPIIDYRVIQVLYDAGLLSSQTISKKTYRKYKVVIEEIVKQTGCNIRTIDRALFAYHKVNHQIISV